MKRIFILLATIISLSAVAQQGYDIKVKLKPFKNQWIYLGHYWGKQMPIIDSVKLDDKSEATFKGSKPLGGGIYLIGFPDRAHNFEILVDNKGSQKFTVIADTATLAQKIEFIGSPDNVMFHDYQGAMQTKGKEVDALMRKRAEHPEDSATLTKQINKVNEEVRDYRKDIMTKHPNSILTMLLKAMAEPEIPKSMLEPKRDSAAIFRYYKSHYFDDINFYDERLGRTPFFEQRVDKYFEQMVYPDADSVTKEINDIMAFAHINKEMEKFFLLKFVNRYYTMKYMWEDRVFVDMYEKYFMNKDYEWLTEKGKKMIQDRYYSLLMNLFGKPAADIELPDSTGKIQKLYNVQSNYTVVVIWDPTCGHCKEIVPRLDSFYQAKWKNMGVKMFGLAKETEGSRKDWTSFLQKHKFNGWYSVYYTKAADKERAANSIPSYSQLYDVQSFPTIYLLDKDKKIIAKKVTEKQLDEILDLRIKSDKSKAKS